MSTSSANSIVWGPSGGTFPTVLRCDNGPDQLVGAMADWAEGQVGLRFIPPGEPWRNGYVESFNSRIRDECLNINSFSGPWPRPAWSSPTGNTTTTTTADIHRWATNRQPATLPPVPTNERLSFAVDQFTGSGHADVRGRGVFV